MCFNKQCCRGLFLLAGLSSSVLFAGVMGTANTGFSYVPEISLQAGGFNASQGSAQHININGSIGDDFTVERGPKSNGLVGLGLYWNAYNTTKADFSLGVNGFYLPHTLINGVVLQEGLFENLSYDYSLTNRPIYFGARTAVHNHFTSKADVTFDAGIGPNIITAYNFGEASLDSGITLPDKIFNNNSSVSLAAMGGVGLKFNQVFGEAAFECGYRFLYLGQGRFSRATDQALSALKTGDGYANAALCSFTI